MTRNKLKRYTGAEVAQPKSIAQQLLEGTRLGDFYMENQKHIKMVMVERWVNLALKNLQMDN